MYTIKQNSKKDKKDGYFLSIDNGSVERKYNSYSVAGNIISNILTCVTLLRKAKIKEYDAYEKSPFYTAIDHVFKCFDGDYVEHAYYEIFDTHETERIVRITNGTEIKEYCIKSKMWKTVSDLMCILGYIKGAGNYYKIKDYEPPYNILDLLFNNSEEEDEEECLHTHGTC